MSGYDPYLTASVPSLLERLADTEETLTAMRSSQAEAQKRFDRLEALLEADPGNPEAPAWRKEYMNVDSVLWWYVDEIPRFETRREMCLRGLRHKGWSI